jgi:hypothetical protein
VCGNPYLASKNDQPGYLELLDNIYIKAIPYKPLGRPLYATAQLMHEEDMYTECHHFERGRPFDDVRHHACCGDNGMIMELLVDDPYMPEALLDIKKKVVPAVGNERARRPGTRRTVVYHGLACNHGRHRSLCTANLARHCLQRMGLKVNIKLYSTARCLCPNRCKKLRHNRGWAEARAIREEWLACAMRAFPKAERIWDAAWIDYEGW